MSSLLPKQTTLLAPAFDLKDTCFSLDKIRTNSVYITLAGPSAPLLYEGSLTISNQHWHSAINSTPIEAKWFNPTPILDERGRTL